jgi:hypothetical protein
VGKLSTTGDVIALCWTTLATCSGLQGSRPGNAVSASPGSPRGGRGGGTPHEQINGSRAEGGSPGLLPGERPGHSAHEAKIDGSPGSSTAPLSEPGMSSPGPGHRQPGDGRGVGVRRRAGDPGKLLGPGRSVASREGLHSERLAVATGRHNRRHCHGLRALGPGEEERLRTDPAHPAAQRVSVQSGQLQPIICLQGSVGLQGSGGFQGSAGLRRWSCLPGWTGVLRSGRPKHEPQAHQRAAHRPCPRPWGTTTLQHAPRRAGLPRPRTVTGTGRRCPAGQGCRRG